MKVVAVTDSLPNYHKTWGGAEQACLRMIEASLHEGIDVSVLTTRPDINACTGNLRFFNIPTLESYIKINAIRSLKQLGIPFDPVSFIAIHRILKRLMPDVVHVHRVNILSLSAVKSARLLNIPVVVSIYDYYYLCPRETLIDSEGRKCTKYHSMECTECMRLKGPKFLKKAFLSMRRKSFDYLLKGVYYHVLSQSSFDILDSYGVSKNMIHKILQMFPIKNIESHSTTKRGLILYIGWIQERKGFHILLKAMPEILKSCTSAHIIAIGAINKDAYFDRIESLIKDNGLSERVSILGKKDYSEVSAYMKEANVVVIPEQWENMSPVVLVEAMNYGKAVVASNIGGIPEFVVDGENGFLADPSSPKDFAEKIIKIIDNEDTAQMFGEKARRHIQQLMDEKRIMMEYKTMYKDMVEAKNV